MNTNQIKDNLKKVPIINNANQNAKINNDVLLAKQNLENLLGKTVQNTIVLDEQNQNNVQQINKNQNNTIRKIQLPQTRKSNSLEAKKQNLKNKENKGNNQNLKMRNSDANRKIMNQNGINNIGQNFKKLPSKGLYGEMKKKISIIKNGKLIYNIDINEESQGNDDTNYNTPHFSNNKNINNNQGVTLQKKHSNIPKEVDNKQTQAQNVVPAKDINQNIQNVKSHHQNNLQIKNKNESFNNQNENIKTVKSIYLNQNDKNGNSNINQLCSQNSVQSNAFNEQSAIQSQNILDTKQIIPVETVKSIYQVKGSNQNSNLLSQFCIGQTAKSVYSGEVKENPYPGIIPNETVNSVYPIKESSNSINKNETHNLLSQMAPGATVKSVYAQQENSQINGLSQMAPGATVKSVYPQPEKSQIKGLSQMLPAETIKSVYNKNESHTLFSQMVPGSTSKSVYTNNK